MAYSSFWEAYLAKNPTSPYTPAGQTWTPGNLQNFANAASALNPTWSPPADQNAKLPNPITPVKFDPYNDVGYAAGASAITNANTHAEAEKDYQYGRGSQLYGINAQGGFDPTNPYSQAAVMKRNYDNSVRGTTNSYAANGQLYAGSLKNAQQQNDFQYGSGSDQLKRSAADYYHSQDLNVQNVADQGISQLAALLGPAFLAFLQAQRG